MTRAAAPVGVLGGTFDPIHNGHLAIASMVRAALDLAGVVFIPAGIPPHKLGQPISPAADRRAMVELAIGADPAFSMSTIELDRPGRSFTVDTLSALAGDRPATAGGLEFILSAEALAGFPTWREPARILELARLAVVRRAGARLFDTAWFDANLSGWRQRIDFVDGPLVDISASDIRDRVRAGASIDGLLPPGVADYIHRHHLYTGAL